MWIFHWCFNERFMICHEIVKLQRHVLLEVYKFEVWHLREMVEQVANFLREEVQAMSATTTTTTTKSK